MTSPKISIIIPVYNVANYLDTCLHSIISQTFHNFEAILVDDGSTDNSPVICKRYTLLDARFKLITIKNHGQSYARNIGLKYAVGEFISFIDADDWVQPYFLETLYRHSSKDSQIVCCKFKDITALQLRTIKNSVNEKVEHINLDTFISRMYNGDLGNVVWNKLFQHDLLKESPFPVGQVHEEVSFFNSLYDCLDNITIVDSVLYGYRSSRRGDTKDTFSVGRSQVFPQLLWMLHYLKRRHLNKALRNTTLYSLVFLNDYYLNLKEHHVEDSEVIYNNIYYYRLIYKEFYNFNYFKAHPKLGLKLISFYLAIRNITKA